MEKISLERILQELAAIAEGGFSCASEVEIVTQNGVSRCYYKRDRARKALALTQKYSYAAQDQIHAGSRPKNV